MQLVARQNTALLRRASRGCGPRSGEARCRKPWSAQPLQDPRCTTLVYKSAHYIRADRRRLHFMLRCLKPALGKDITLVIVQDWEEYYRSCDHFMEACLYCRQPRCARCDRSSRATGTEICYCMRPTRSSTRLNNKRRFSVGGNLFTMVPLHACYPLLYEDDY